MSVLDKLLGLIAPHQCLGCGAEGALLCPACWRQCAPLPERCYRCRKVSAGFLTCPACRRASKLQAVRPAVSYEGLAKELVWSLKFAGAQAAAQAMAARMPLAGLNEHALIVHVPTAPSRARERGYDQAELLARAVSRRLHRPRASYLARLGKQHQVGASRRQRLSQLQGAFYVPRPAPVRGAHIILVDDVLTTGATLEAATAALRAAGARRVEALVFAQA